MKPRRVVLLSLTLIAVVLGAALSYARRDTTPPQLYVEVPERVAAETSFDLSISADEPVTYRIRYGELELSEVTQNFDLSLVAKPGSVPLNISATDGAENESIYDFQVYGVPKLASTLSAQAALIPGEPLSVSLSWEGELEPTALELSVDGEPREVFRQDGRATFLMGVPLGAEEGSLRLGASLSDEYGRQSMLERVVTVLPDPRPVQDLNLSSSTLSVITPEGRAQEAAMLEAAYARIDETPTPLWTESFLLPIQGRDTSGFGSPRRYAAGGNVSYHNGSDMAAPAGTPILATNTGRVLVADVYPIKGGFTLIDHGAGLYSYYLHQSKLLVAAGDTVQRGQVIGEVGTTGLSTGPHLHWEMRVRGVATNPMSWVDKVFP